MDTTRLRMKMKIFEFENKITNRKESVPASNLQAAKKKLSMKYGEHAARIWQIIRTEL